MVADTLIALVALFGGGYVCMIWMIVSLIAIVCCGLVVLYLLVLCGLCLLIVLFINLFYSIWCCCMIGLVCF